MSKSKWQDDTGKVIKLTITAGFRMAERRGTVKAKVIEKAWHNTRRSLLPVLKSEVLYCKCVDRMYYRAYECGFKLIKAGRSTGNLHFWAK